VPLEIEQSPRPEWSPLPYEGCVGVDGKVLVREWGFFIAMLRFQPEGTIHEHPGPNDTVVICLEGEGWTSVAGERAPIRAGELVRWPKDVPHRLWTEGTEMTTLMFEQLPQAP
jgi:quercetin dioxygenase-like cupin family protein